MAPKLYMIPASPPVRSTLMTAKAIGVTLDLIHVDLLTKEHLNPEYLKLNPQHTVPTLDDNGFVVWDSHAINIYLIAKYGKDDSLYPKNPQTQATINKMLYFDSSLLFPPGLAIITSIVREGAKTIAPEKAAVVTENYLILEKVLEGRQWVAGDSVTLADLSLITTVTSIAVMVPLDASIYPNITAWIKRAETLPYYDANQQGKSVAFKMTPKLYMIPPSPPVRSTLMTAKAIGLTLDLIPVDLSKKENLTPEYLKLNPQHTVPTLDDNGFVVWDSHAINIYLIAKYGKDDSLYPKDPQKQATINKMLYFDSSLFFPSGLAIIKPIVRDAAKTVPPEKAAVVTENYLILEKILEGRQWVAGDSVTLADLSLITTITSIAVVVPLDASIYPNITAWIIRAQTLPYYDANQQGLDMFTNMVQGLLHS